MTAAWRLAFLAVVFVFSAIAFSEPWLSSRYAQNCAACHAPGRVNVKSSERRCTLNCQGCHTNPQGGGLRNFYGKWTQERWLNSTYIKGYKLNEPRPAVTDEQYYHGDKLKKYLAGAKNGDDKKSKARRRTLTDGFRLKETDERLDEEKYDRTTTPYGEVYSMREATYRMPQDDPWRLRRERYFNAGLDLRYFYMDSEKKSGATTSKVDGTVFPMAADISLSVEPIHGLSFVYESRFLNGPNEAAWYSAFNKSFPRSAFILVDDLPYNTYVQYGLYRPQFGHYTPDHTSLFASATGMNMRYYNRAVSIGTAPNVPFANFHYILPVEGGATEGGSKEKGYGGTIGGRFVMLGMYGMLSYWNTSDKSGPIEIQKRMTGFTGGMTFGLNRYTVVVDVTRVERENVGAVKDAGTVMTLENRLRLFKENYLKAHYESLNTTRALTEGNISGYTVGFTSFPISSVELDLSYKTYSGKDAADKTSEKYLLGQFHFYF